MSEYIRFGLRCPVLYAGGTEDFPSRIGTGALLALLGAVRGVVGGWVFWGGFIIYATCRVVCVLGPRGRLSVRYGSKAVLGMHLDVFVVAWRIELMLFNASIVIGEISV